MPNGLVSQLMVKSLTMHFFFRCETLIVTPYVSNRLWNWGNKVEPDCHC